jgi:hypothetical protein
MFKCLYSPAIKIYIDVRNNCCNFASLKIIDMRLLSTKPYLNNGQLRSKMQEQTELILEQKRN